MVILRNLCEVLNDVLVIVIQSFLEKIKTFISFNTMDHYHNPLKYVCVVDVSVPGLQMKNWNVAG